MQKTAGLFSRLRCTLSSQSEQAPALEKTEAHIVTPPPPVEGLTKTIRPVALASRVTLPGDGERRVTVWIGNQSFQATLI